MVLRMARDFVARLHGDSERALTWRQVFGGDEVHLQSPFPQRVSLPIGEREVYFLDLELLTFDQRARLIDHLGHTFGMSRGEVIADLPYGVPILAEDLTVAWSCRCL